MRRVALVGAALWLAACQSAAGEGAACARASDCPSPLVCGLGRCRAECAQSRDCPIGARCLASAPGIGVCSIAAEATCTDFCAAPLRCENNQCRTECTSDGDCRAGRCVNATCVEPTSGVDAGPSSDTGAGDDTGAGPQDAGLDAGQPMDAGLDAAMPDAGALDAGLDAGDPDAFVAPADMGVDAACSTGCQEGTRCVSGRIGGACGYGGHLCSTCATCASGVCSGGDTCAAPFDITSYGTYVFPIDTCMLADDVSPAPCTGGGGDAIFAVHRTASSQLRIRTDPPATIAYLSGTMPCAGTPITCNSVGDLTSNGSGPGVVDRYAVESISGCGQITVTFDYGP